MALQAELSFRWHSGLQSSNSQVVAPRGGAGTRTKHS